MDERVNAYENARRAAVARLDAGIDGALVRAQSLSPADIAASLRVLADELDPPQGAFDVHKNRVLIALYHGVTLISRTSHTLRIGESYAVDGLGADRNLHLIVSGQ